MAKNNTLQPLSRKKDFDLLRKKARSFSFQWLKALFLCGKSSGNLKIAWSLPKKHVSDSVTRNRLKRWGRENLRQRDLKGWILMIFLKKDKTFYKRLKRKDFDHVFNSVLEKMDSKT